ncbi:hypothetical protein K2173_026523 [Erythroxylum novogranatense]|uniref:Pentatricopeptide repeat-containing protein At2g13600-like n=1 Tax=Erythroxylum novogranatense TaxID=1862640 RepID=A0AAV8TXS9_9ROSI|nr:hypothetical protein K2173_026523 [Erythroxylum novogranatense]
MIIHPPSRPSLPTPSHCDTKLTNTNGLSFQAHNRKTRKPVHISQEKASNSSIFASLLNSCHCRDFGMQVHAHAIKTGFGSDEFVDTKLLQMYSRCGCLEDANFLFDSMPVRNSYAWTAILDVHLDRGLCEEAVSLFQELQFEEVNMEFFVFPVVLKICASLGMVELGRQVHGIVSKNHFFSNVYVSNALIDMYGKCGSLGDSKKVFSLMAKKDSVSWNSVITACAANGMVYEALDFLEKMACSDNMIPNIVSWSAIIGGFAQNGYDEEALELLHRMLAEGLEPNARTLASVLPACARLQKLKLGKEFHGYITRRGFMSNHFAVNGLVDIYRRCGDMGSAFKIFSNFSVKNAVSCNTMIVGYCENGNVSKAKKLFLQMESAGIKRDLISWNSMISGYVDNLLFHEALNMFQELMRVEGIEPDSFTLGSALNTCADLSYLGQGKQIHSHAIIKGLQSNTFVGGALVEMYSRCHDVVAAQMAFNEVVEKDIPIWNALISGYARCNQIEKVQILLQKMKEDGYEQNIYTWNGILAGHLENGHLDLAMKLFYEIQTLNLRPDIYTIGIALAACSRLATLERGKQVHAYSVRLGYDSSTHIGAALVNMYAKCGYMKYSQLVYDRISSPNLVSHNAMLTAYAMHGYGVEGIALFLRILDAGFTPDSVTFLSCLTSCAHAGSVGRGRELFNLMSFYNLKPTLKHYTALVDLLSRSGQLGQAYELVKNLPMEPDSVLWGTLLGGCVIHGHVGLGVIAGERLIELEPNSSGNFVLLANLYAYARRWSDLGRIRQMMKDEGLLKNPGCSWIEDKYEIHAFLSCDRSHRRVEEIYTTVDNLTLHMKTWKSTELK